VKKIKDGELNREMYWKFNMEKKKNQKEKGVRDPSLSL